MKKFIRKIIFFFCVPLSILILCYLLTDPFKNLTEFNLSDCSTVNREYTSIELFLRNNHTYQYNSFIFGSSRACGLNSYYWKHKLGDNNIRQFVFQSWVETVTGIYQKLNFLEKEGSKIDNALILIDIPSSFSKEQQSTKVLSLKDYRLSGKSYFYNQFYYFIAYLKPLKISESVINSIHQKKEIANFDTISNDWNKSNIHNLLPLQNRNLDKSKFLKLQIQEKEIESLISSDLENVLFQINNILTRNKTKFKIIITPDFYQNKINQRDLLKLQNIFGESNVINFSGKNSINIDMYNFTDPNHFDLNVGKQIIDFIYN